MKYKIFLDYLFSTGVIAAPIAGVGYLYVDQKNISWKDIVSFLKQQQELIKEEEQDDKDGAIADTLPLPPPPSDDLTSEDDAVDEEEESKTPQEPEVKPIAEEPKKTDKKDSKKTKKQKPINKQAILKIIDDLIKSWEEKKSKETEEAKTTKFTTGITAFKTIKGVLETSYQDADTPDDKSNDQGKITT